MKILIKQYYLHIIVGLALMLSVLAFLFSLHQSPPVEGVDLKLIMGQFVSQEVKRNDTSEVQAQRVALFTSTLEQVMSQYASKHHVVLVPAPAIIAGGKDVTAGIQQLMNEKLAKNA